MMARQGVSGAQCRNFSENYKILFTLFLIGASSFNYLTKLHKWYLFFRSLVCFSRYEKVIFLFPHRFSHSQ